MKIKTVRHKSGILTTLGVYSFVLISSLISTLISLMISSSLRAQEPVSQQTIPFLTYHIGEPFIVNAQARLGLTYELADLLSKRSDGRYVFEVKPLLRLKLNERLSHRWQQHWAVHVRNRFSELFQLTLELLGLW